MILTNRKPDDDGVLLIGVVNALLLEAAAFLLAFAVWRFA